MRTHNYYTYILTNRPGGTLYTGVTNDLFRRVAEHREGSANSFTRRYNLRHLVRPGLTGWAQVKYGYAGDEQDALEKLQYEFFYLEHQDAAFDFRIMLRTFRSMLGGVGVGR